MASNPRVILRVRCWFDSCANRWEFVRVSKHSGARKRRTQNAHTYAMFWTNILINSSRSSSSSANGTVLKVCTHTHTRCMCQTLRCARFLLESELTIRLPDTPCETARAILRHNSSNKHKNHSYVSRLFPSFTYIHSRYCRVTANANTSMSFSSVRRLDE